LAAILANRSLRRGKKIGNCLAGLESPVPSGFLAWPAATKSHGIRLESLTYEKDCLQPR